MIIICGGLLLQRLHLNFCKIFSTEIIDRKDKTLDKNYFKTKFSSLPPYKLGNPQNQSSGYLDFKLIPEKEFLNSETGWINDIITKSYVYEKYFDEEVFFKNDKEHSQAFRQYYTDIFWIYPSLLIIRGSERDAEKTFETLTEFFEGEVKFEPIKFHHDFFMWLSCKDSGIIDSDLKIISISRDETIHNEESYSSGRFGNLTFVSGSNNAIISPQTLSALSCGQKLSKVWVSFEIENFEVNAYLSNLKGIYVYLNSSGFINKEKNTRFTNAIVFINKILNVYLDWIDLESEDKYPPESCLKKMYSDLEDQIEPIFEGFNENILDYYRNKGNKKIKKES